MHSLQRRAGRGTRNICRVIALPMILVVTRTPIFGNFEELAALAYKVTFVACFAETVNGLLCKNQFT